MKGFKLVLAAAFLSGTVVAFAAEKTVTQKGKVFSETEIAIKVGDTITFVNDDNVFHNVLSTHSENKFNLGSLKPGRAPRRSPSRPQATFRSCALCIRP